MKVFIAGIDGYLGWPLAIHLSAHGHEVAGADLLLRREWVNEVGGVSAQPIASREERLCAFRQRFGKDLAFHVGDLTDYEFCVRFVYGIPAGGGGASWPDALSALLND